MRLHPLLPHRFPTSSELVGRVAQGGSAPQPARLFETLVGDPNVLLQSLLRCPAKYESGVAELLQKLTSGSSKLSTLSGDELDLLDRAVIDFNRPDIPPKSRAVVPPKALRPLLEEPEQEEEGYETHEDGDPQPKTAELPPYWWTRSSTS